MLQVSNKNTKPWTQHSLVGYSKSNVVPLAAGSLFLHVVQRREHLQHSSAWERSQAPPRTFLLFVTERAVPHTVWIMHQTSQQLLTSCSSELPADHESSSAYLHLQRRIALTSSKRSQSHHRLLVPPSGFTKLLLGLSQVQRKGMGPTFLGKWNTLFFFFRAKLRQKLRAGVGGGGVAREEVVEIKSLQVPGERTQSAKRAKERRRDKRFLFKLIPLRPSRFPSQDSQKSDKNLAQWIWRGTRRGDGEEERWFRGERNRKNRGELWGERSQSRQIKGRQGRQEGWAPSPWVHPGSAVCQQRARAGRTGAISYQTHVTCLMMCSTNQPWVYLYPAQVLAAEMLDRLCWPEIRLWMWLVSLSTACWGLKGTSTIRATQRPRSLPDTPQTCPVDSRSTHQHTPSWCVCVLSNSTDAFYSIIWSPYHQGSTVIKEETTIYSLLCCQMSRLKPNEKIKICTCYLFTEWHLKVHQGADGSLNITNSKKFMKSFWSSKTGLHNFHCLQMWFPSHWLIFSEYTKGVNNTDWAVTTKCRLKNIIRLMCRTCCKNIPVFLQRELCMVMHFPDWNTL